MTVGLKVDAGGPITAGSILSGRVYLSVSEQDQAAQSIRLKVVGKEHVVVHHTTNENRNNETITRHHYEKCSYDIWTVNYPLKIFPGGYILPGQYEFPFALQLPQTLPSTMFCRLGQSNCEVRFEVVAEIYRKPNSIFHTNPYAKETLNVAAIASATPNHNTSLQLPVEVVPITRCCCLCCRQQGTIALETKIDKTVVACTGNNNTNGCDGDQNTVTVHFRCKNKSTVGVSTIRAQLVETVEWTSRGHMKKVKTILAESTKDATSYPELHKLFQKPSRQQQQQDYSERHVLFEHKPWHTIGPLVVPRQAKDTYQGRGIRVRHMLSFLLITEGRCATNPEMSSSLEVYRSLASSSEVATAVSNNPLPASVLEGEVDLSTPTMVNLYDQYKENQSDLSGVLVDVPSSNYGSASVPTVEAHMVLPDDWNAHTADVVNIPMAVATILGPADDAGFSR